jgi:hypothetical protein
MKALTPVLAVLFVLVVTLQGQGWDGDQGDEEAVGLCQCAAGNSISLTTVTPNPGGKAGQIQGGGKWGVDPNDNFSYIRFLVTIKGSNPPNNTYQDITTAPPNNTWSITLLVAAPQTYNPCTATLGTTDKATGLPNSVSVQNTDDQKVK